MSEPLRLIVQDENGVRVNDPEFMNVSDIRIETLYPAGVFGTASFYLPIDIVSRSDYLDLNYTVTIKDDALVVYHGYIDDLSIVNSGGVRGVVVTCVGPWGKHMVRRGINRRWCDTDLRRWEFRPVSSTNGGGLATHDTRNRIRIVPKAEAWVTNNNYVFRYDAPTGETVGRTSVSYDLQEGAQDWNLRMYELPSTTNIFTISASGTGSDTSDLAANQTGVVLQIFAGANQTPTADGTYYGEVSNVEIYAGRDHASATLGNVNLYEVALDIIDRLGVDETTISSSLQGLDSSLTLAVKPFVTNGYESYSSVIARIASYGESTQTPIGYYLTAPNEAPDNLPMLVTETYPALTDFEYTLSLRENDINVRQNLDEIWNWIVVEYTDLEGVRQVVTPDDSSNLTDSDSVAEFGQQEKVVRIAEGDQADAINYGRRYLARHKRPIWAVTQPVTVTEIRTKAGALVPSRWIRAGQRVRIIDLPVYVEQGIRLDDAAFVKLPDKGIAFLITATNYDHNTRQNQISLGGVPDDLGIYMAQLSMLAKTTQSPATESIF